MTPRLHLRDSAISSVKNMIETRSLHVAKATNCGNSCKENMSDKSGSAQPRSQGLLCFQDAGWAWRRPWDTSAKYSTNRGVFCHVTQNRNSFSLHLTNGSGMIFASPFYVYACHAGYFKCPISAQIGPADNQSDLRILL